MEMEFQKAGRRDGTGESVNRPRALRCRGRLTSLFDPATAVLTEDVTGDGVTLRTEKPRDHEFWMEVHLSAAWLAAKLVEVRAAEARRRAAAAMSAWTPGRELA